MTELALKVRLTGDGRQLEGTLRGTRQQLDGLGGSARKAGQAAGTAGGQVRQLGTHVGATRGAVGRLSTATGAARQRLGQFASTTQSASAGLVGLVSRTGLLVAGIAGVGMGLKSAVGSFVDYDSTMRRVGVISEATAEQMGRMRAMALDLGATTRFSTGEAAEGFQFLAMAGLDAEQSMAALPGVLNLAAAGAMGLGTAADIATNVLGAYGKTAADLGEVTDIMARTFLRSNTNLQELGQAAVYAAGTAKAADQDFLTFNTTLGLMADVGVKGSQAGTSLGMAMSRLLDPTGAATKALEGAGVAVRDADGKVRQFDAILADLSETSGAAALLLDAFGQEAGAKLVNVLGLGRAAIERKRDVISEYEGAARSAAEALKGSLGGALTELGSAADGAGIALIGLLEGALIRVVEGITAFVSAITSALRTITPAWTEVFGRITQQTATVMTALVGMAGSMVTGMTGEFQSIEPSWLAVVATIPRALEATVQTVTLIAIKLTLQVANALEELKPRSAQVWNSIKATTLSIMATIEEAVINAYRAILSAIGGLVADAGVQLIGLARTTATVSETMARKVEDAAISMQKLGRDMQTTGQHSSSLRGQIGELDAENAALSAGMRGVNQTYRVQIDTIDEMIAEYWAEVDAIQRSVDGRDEVVEAIDRESGARQTIESQLTTAIEQLDTSTEASKGAKGATDQLRESLEETGPAAKKAATEQAEAAQQAATAQAEAAKESERAWKQLGDSIQSNLSNAFVNLVDKGLSSFSDLVDTIKTWFVKLLADLAAAALAKPIMLAIGATGMGSMINPALAGGAPGGGLFDLAGSGASLVNAGSSVAGLLGFGGAAAGTAGIVGGSASAAAGIGGGLGALGGTSFGAASATGGMMAAASAALPILLPIAGAILAFGGLFGGKPSNKAAFADINLASGGIDLSAMTGDKAPSQGTLELRDALASSVAAFATALGEFSDVTLETVRLDIGERDGIQADFGAGLVSFGNDIEAAMTAIFERIAGQAQGLAAWLQDLAGMDLAAALQGLLIIRELNPLFERLGQSAIALDAAGAQAGSHLLALAGDIETLTGRMDRYYQAFFSTEERLGHLTEDLTAQFDALGLTMPSTKAGLRELIESLDLTTDAGRESFVALMELAPGFATLVEGQAALLDAERQRIDEMLRMAGISGDQIATTLRDAMLGRISADDAGGLIAEQVLGGIHNAVAGGFANQITTLFMDTIVTPAVQAAVTGGSVAEAVSQAAIDNMIAQAKAAAAALGAILNDPGFKQALADIGQVITDSVTTITPARPYTPPARTFTSTAPPPVADGQGGSASAAAADEAFSTAAELRRALLLDTLGSTGSALDRLSGWFDDMSDAAGRLGVDMGEVTGVLSAQLRELTASWDPATLRDMAGHFPDLTTQLLALADTADAATTAAQQQANAQAGAELRDDLNRQLMSGAHRALADLVGWLEATGASATDLGVDLGLVQQVFEQRFSALLDGLPLDQLDALVALFPAFGDRIDGVATQMRAAAAAAQHQAAAQAALVRQQAGSAFLDDLMAQIYGLTDQAWVNDAAKAIQDYQDGLADAADLGVDAADRLDTILGLSLQNLMAQAGLTGSQLGQLTDLFPEFAEQLQQAFDTVLDARNAAAAQQRANDAVTASATAAADSTTAAADSIERLARAADPGAPSTDPYAQRADWLRAWADQMPEAVATIGAGPAAGADNQSPQRPGYAALLSGMHDAVQQWQDAGRPRGEEFADMHTAIRAWRAEQARREMLTDPPGFAAGGTHPGGWRMVGERGPELEFTPPSRIFSAPDTRAMVGNDLAAEVRALREELRVAQYRIAKNTGKTAKYLERWDGDGLPPERTT